jgi:hypothetical protein
MGKLLGTGLLYRTAKSQYMVDNTIEGAELALVMGEIIKQLLKSGKIVRTAVPLTESIVEAVCGNQPLQIPWNLFY